MSPGAAHEEDLLTNESRCCTWRGLVKQWVQALNILRHFCHPKVFIESMWQNANVNKCNVGKNIPFQK